MAKRFDEVQFILAYSQAHKAGQSSEDLARTLGVTTEIVYGRTFSLRKRGFRLPKLRRAANAARPTLGDELFFDTDFLRKPVPFTFTITVAQESVHAC